jgi:hypothetical protein
MVTSDSHEIGGKVESLYEHPSVNYHPIPSLEKIIDSVRDGIVPSKNVLPYHMDVESLAYKTKSQTYIGMNIASNWLVVVP